MLSFHDVIMAHRLHISWDMLYCPVLAILQSQCHANIMPDRMTFTFVTDLHLSQKRCQQLDIVRRNAASTFVIYSTYIKYVKWYFHKCCNEENKCLLQYVDKIMMEYLLSIFQNILQNKSRFFKNAYCFWWIKRLAVLMNRIQTSDNPVIKPRVMIWRYFE